MNPGGHAQRALASALMLCVGLSGGAIAQSPECNQTDTTVTCCLKKHPGQYERCGAMAPKQPSPKKKPNRLPPPTGSDTEEKRKREELCRERWYQCIQAGGEYEKRGMYGRTICQSCWDKCRAEGAWPSEVNDLPCLGEAQ